MGRINVTSSIFAGALAPNYMRRVRCAKRTDSDSMRVFCILTQSYQIAQTRARMRGRLVLTRVLRAWGNFRQRGVDLHVFVFTLDCSNCIYGYSTNDAISTHPPG